MRKRIMIATLTLAVLAFFTLNAGAADLKIGVVDFQKVVNDSDPGKKFEADMKAEGEQMEAEIAQLKEEKELLWRVQTAQSDALKQWPRLWLEEVEKAIEQNPNRRRQPALVPVREEFD